MERSYYIVIEGGEGCGKSTHAKLLTQFLNEKGLPAERKREPGSSTISEEIRGLVLSPKSDLTSLTELFLFEAARLEFFRKDVIPNLNKGVSIVADRSGYSTEAYQGYAGGIELDLIKQLNTLATFGIKPDLAFLLDIPAEKGLEKETNQDRFAIKGVKYHEKVNQGYRNVAKENPDVFVVIPYVEGKLKEMQEQIREYVHERLKV
ncbi:dTMP kinase [Candidatus Pacearchaeota archaeon]|nr:MAG: dTMP kinase [Candidatus Pacearchaeota archaeon]